MDQISAGELGHHERAVRSRAVFSYDVQTTAGWRSALRRALAVAAILTVLAITFPIVYRLYDTRDVRDVDGVLRSAPNVQSVEHDCWHHDELSCATILDSGVYLDAARSKVIWFSHPIASELSSGSHLRLSFVGDIPLYRRLPDTSICNNIDVGRDGEFAGMLPFGVRGVGDLTSHYDELLAFVKSLPPAVSYTAKDGTRFEFCTR